MGITFTALLDCLPYVTAIQKPIMLRGRHGIGKSCVVYQFAKQIGKPVIERRVSQMTEGDIIGLPKISDDGTENCDNCKTSWILPDFLLEACRTPVVLFFDELDRGTLEVRQSVFELCDSHKIAGHKLHPETLIFAAINGGDSGSQYQVGELDPAELDRWTVFDCEPSIEDWLNWAKNGNNINTIIWDFINQNHQHLEHLKDFEPNKVYPSRRSWHRFSDCLAKGEKILLQKDKLPIATVANLANAFVGLEATVAFCDFLKYYSFQVKPEDILDNGKFELLKNFNINDHLALVEKLAAIFNSGKVLSEVTGKSGEERNSNNYSAAFGIPLPKNHTDGFISKKNSSSTNKKLDKETEKFQKAYNTRLQNLAKYFKLLPSEIAMKLLDVVAQGGPQRVIDLHKQPGVQDYLTKVLTAENSKENSGTKK